MRDTDFERFDCVEDAIQPRVGTDEQHVAHAAEEACAVAMGHGESVGTKMREWQPR